MLIAHLYCVAFDGDAALTFQIHVVQELILLFTITHCSSVF